MPKKKRVVIMLLVLALLGGGAAVAYVQLHRPEAVGNELVLHGNVDIRVVDLAFNGNQRIAEMLVTEGDRVTAGQLVATLDTRRLEPRVAGAEAQMRMQKEVVARLVAGPRPQEIGKARADVAAAEAMQKDAQLTFERTKALVEKAAATGQQLDNARAAIDSATAQVNAAGETLGLLEAGTRREDIAAAQATLAAYEAELDAARRELDDARLVAPTDGVVQDRILEPGDMASPARPVYTLAITDPMWVRAYVDEADLGRIRDGMAAAVHTDTFPDKSYEGWIGYISPTAEFTPKAVETRQVRTSLVYQVRVYVRNPAGELRLGMPATVVIPLNPSPQQASGDSR